MNSFFDKVEEIWGSGLLHFLCLNFPGLRGWLDDLSFNNEPHFSLLSSFLPVILWLDSTDEGTALMTFSKFALWFGADVSSLLLFDGDDVFNEICFFWVDILAWLSSFDDDVWGWELFLRETDTWSGVLKPFENVDKFFSLFSQGDTFAILVPTFSGKPRSFDLLFFMEYFPWSVEGCLATERSSKS